MFARKFILSDVLFHFYCSTGNICKYKWKCLLRRIPYASDGSKLQSFCYPISYLESSFLTAHGLTKRATLERSVRGAVLIGCWKTMQMTGLLMFVSAAITMCSKVNTLLTFIGQGWWRNHFYFCCRGLQDLTLTNGGMSSKVMPSLPRQDSEAARCLHALYDNISLWFGLKSVKLYAKVLHKNPASGGLDKY